jgi:hypothetical protein
LNPSFLVTSSLCPTNWDASPPGRTDEFDCPFDEAGWVGGQSQASILTECIAKFKNKD